MYLMTVAADRSPSSSLAFLFDLDGTLVDRVYQHVLAWQRAVRSIGAEPG